MDAEVDAWHISMRTEEGSWQSDFAGEVAHKALNEIECID